MSYHKLTPEQIQYACKSYIAGKSTPIIGKELGVSDQAILFNLEKQGVKRRTTEEAAPRKHPVDKTFFDVIDTEAKAYWLGFLYADGCVINARNVYLSVTLAKKDKKHLERLVKDLQTTSTIHGGHRENCSINGRAVGPTDWVAVHIHSRRLCEGLISKGCGPRKSLTVEFPTFEQVPEHLLHHFIRGYFDGDGSLSYSSQGGRNQFHFKILGTPKFLEGCLSYFERRGIPRVSIGVDAIGAKISRIAFGGNRNIQNIYRLLFKDATIWLSRKRERFDACVAQPTAKSNGRPLRYTFKSPTGEIHSVFNLSKWCRDNELGNHRWFYGIASGERPSHKGWTLVAA